MPPPPPFSLSPSLPSHPVYLSASIVNRFGNQLRAVRGLQFHHHFFARLRNQFGGGLTHFHGGGFWTGILLLRLHLPETRADDLLLLHFTVFHHFRFLKRVGLLIRNHAVTHICSAVQDDLALLPCLQLPAVVVLRHGFGARTCVRYHFREEVALGVRFGFGAGLADHFEGLLFADCWTRDGNLGTELAVRFPRAVVRLDFGSRAVANARNFSFYFQADLVVLFSRTLVRFLNGFRLAGGGGGAAGGRGGAAGGGGGGAAGGRGAGGKTVVGRAAGSTTAEGMQEEEQQKEEEGRNNRTKSRRKRAGGASGGRAGGGGGGEDSEIERRHNMKKGIE